MPIAVATLLLLMIGSCGGSKSDERKSPYRVGDPIVDTLNRGKVLPPFAGNYSVAFNDSAYLHQQAADKLGIPPMQTAADTSAYVSDERLIKLPQVTPIFRVEELTHSIPYVVPEMARLLVIISKDFQDSLRNKGLPPYRLLVTSVTRTTESVASLRKTNKNAIEGSVHCYGTTIDITWKRYEKLFGNNTAEVPANRLKHVLGEVLHNLKHRELCYVKHEKRQACFHITTR